MVLTRSTGMTRWDYCGRTNQNAFYVSIAENIPKQPLQWSNAVNTAGYKMSAALHLSPGSDTVDSWTFSKARGSVQNLILSASTTNDYVDFDETPNRNVGVNAAGEYGSEPLPQYGYFTVYSAAKLQGATENNTNAVYVEDNNDTDMDTPPPEIDQAYELTARSASGFQLYGPNMPASARLAKDLLCGNLNKIGYTSKNCLTTVISDDNQNGAV